jgi:hypothetical protein
MQSWPLPKDPDAVLDYQFDWSQYLQAGETILTSTFIVVGSDSLVLSNESVAGGVTTFWAAGGVSGEAAQITNRITTDQGRTDDDTALLRIRPR